MHLTRSGTRALTVTVGALAAVALSLVFLAGASAGLTPPPTTVGGFGANATVTAVTIDAASPAANVAVVAPGSSHSITATVTIPFNGYYGWYETPIGFQGAAAPFDPYSCVTMWADDVPYTQTLAFTAPSSPGIYKIVVDQGMNDCEYSWHTSASTVIAEIVVASAPPAVVTGFGADASVTEVTIDGADPDVNFAYVEPGSSHSITATVTIPDNPSSYLYTTPMGFQGAAAPFGEDGCIYGSPDTVVTGTQQFTAPSTPGVYNIVVDQGPNYTCADSWHSSASTAIAQIVVTDMTAPTITITTPVDGAAYILNQSVTADYECTDGASGVASCTGTVDDGSTIDTSTLGSHAFTVDAADNAFNTASKTVHYTVVYGWQGFFQPVDNAPVLNVVKAGSAVPLKFSLTGDQGLSIFAAGFPKSAVVACDSTEPTDTLESTATAGASGLGYDATLDQYTYVWKTEKAWTGCRRLDLKLLDGTMHTAFFKFTK